MDSYSLRFERMNILDLHPLSLPISRLSPAKSTSSIDQYTHHQGKGDSAYSSFSGGSSAPDYPSPFLPDDFHPHSLHYADLKYVKALYGPNILESDSKSMNQLYHSMEAIAQQHQHHQNKNGCLHVKDSPEISTSLLPPPPPPPPIRLDSFMTTRSLETSRARQSPEGQLADISSLRTQVANPEALCTKPDPTYDCRVVQHYQRDQLKQDISDTILESKSATILNQLPQQRSQSEHSQQTKGRMSEMHSADAVSVTEQERVISSWHTAQNTISGSVQHKGQFYFVTGMYKSLESSVPQAQRAVEILSTESHWQAEQQMSRSSVENVFKYVEPDRQPNSPDGPYGKLFFQEEKKISPPNDYKEPPGNYDCSNVCKTEKASQKADGYMDIGRYHNTNHPMFYCGPEKNFSASDTSQNKIFTEKHHDVHAKKDGPVSRLTRLPLAEMPTEKISKEATPLLYHLTGASRASLMNKVKNEKNSTLGSQNPEWGRDKQKARKESFSGDSSHSELSKEEKLNEFSYPYNTVDDSFKKYYKEKLKDVQSKVLRETSFKRKDLQLSWPNRIDLWSDKNLSVIPCEAPLQDVHSKLENPVQTHLLKFQETDKETLKNPSQEIEKETEKETVRQQNIPQPQVPRVGCRKRLTPEQKKLSHSEPEKLHQLADRPIHMTCRSLGSESEVLLSEDHFSDHGLVAARRKMFETRGRALSASSFSKSTLKHLQHKALVEYIERKTGHKVAVPSQRHSTAGRKSEWGPRSQSATSGSEKKLLRPQSAGRILDSSSRSAHFTYAQPIVLSSQSVWKEGSPPPSGKCASVENLLDVPEQPGSYKTRSTSTPLVFEQVHRHVECSPANDKGLSSTQIKKVECDRPVYKHYAGSVPDQRRMRVMVPRGKSLEELGVSKVISPRHLSKSSEQLHQPSGEHIVSGRGKRDLVFIEKQEHTQRKLKQDSVPLVSEKVAPEHQFTKEPCSLEHPPTVFHSRVGVCSLSSATSVSEASARVNCMPSFPDIHPVSLRGSGYNDKESKVTSAANSPAQTSENLHDSKIKTGLQKQSLLIAEESLGHEVSLSLGVTTDPSLWIMPPEIDDSNGDEGTQYPQKTLPATGVEMETAANPSNPDTEFSPAVGRNQERKENENKHEPPVVDRPEEDNLKDQTWWEMLVQEVVSSDQSLARILYPITNRKTALMLMEQLLSEDTLLMEEHYKKKLEQKMSKPEPTTDSPEMADVDKENNLLTSNEDDVTPRQQRQCSTGGDVKDKKRQLISLIKEQLMPLEGLRSSLLDEERENRAQGDAMAALVRECCMPTELERYTQFIGDLERVVNLLLCLSARLARVQNALSSVDENTDAEEKQSLDNRHHLLCKQREDAKDLKDNLDRRERMVSTFLAKQLTDAQMQDYRRFVQTKASLLIRQKDLDEKQRLGEEQLEALLNSIPP